MPVFKPEFDEVKATTQIYDKGKYLLKVKKVIGTAFIQNPKAKNESTVIVNGERLSVGARVFLEIIGKYDSRGSIDPNDPNKGEEASDNTFWLHNKGSLKMTKQALMGIFKFNENQEEEFNRWYKENEFGYSIEETEEGKYEIKLDVGWLTLEEMEIVANLDKGLYKNAETQEESPQQKYKNWSAPVPQEMTV